jgi:hypothetical protein
MNDLRMFVVGQWTGKGEDKELRTHAGAFDAYHEANERAKEIGPACFPKLLELKPDQTLIASGEAFTYDVIGLPEWMEGRVINCGGWRYCLRRRPNQEMLPRETNYESAMEALGGLSRELQIS